MRKRVARRFVFWGLITLLLAPRLLPGAEGAATEAPESYGPDASLASSPTPEPPKPNAPPKLVDVFSIQENPGSGTLLYKLGNKEERVDFGIAAGHYVFGMAFQGSKLPYGYAKDFKDEVVLQIAIGNLASNLSDQLPQFGAATLIGQSIPQNPRTYEITVPTPGKPDRRANIALLLFSSPSTPNNQGDEEKLKGTYFAQKGEFVLGLKDKPKVVSVKSAGETLWFKLYRMKARLNLNLATPFNVQGATLSGTIEFPLYAPHGNTAEVFTRRIAGESLESPMSQLEEKAQAQRNTSPPVQRQVPRRGKKSK